MSLMERVASGTTIFHSESVLARTCGMWLLRVRRRTELDTCSRQKARGPTQPKARLAAELRWLIELAPSRAHELINRIVKTLEACVMPSCDPRAGAAISPLSLPDWCRVVKTL